MYELLPARDIVLFAPSDPFGDLFVSDGVDAPFPRRHDPPRRLRTRRALRR